MEESTERERGEEETRKSRAEQSETRETHLLQNVQWLVEEGPPHPIHKSLPPTQKHHEPQQSHPKVPRRHEGEEDVVPVKGGEGHADVDDDGHEEPGQDGDEEEK